MLATKVLFPRIGSNGAKLFFALAIGTKDESGKEQFGLIIRDLVLRESNNGKGDYTAFPSKPRLKKVGDRSSLTYEQQVKDSKPIYDQIVDLYYEGQGDDRKVTEFSWDTRKQIIEQAVAAFDKLSSGDTGRGGAASAEVPAEFARSTGVTTEKKASLFDEEDDDMPF